jgi:hypothetical protein
MSTGNNVIALIGDPNGRRHRMHTSTWDQTIRPTALTPFAGRSRYANNAAVEFLS